MDLDPQVKVFVENSSSLPPARSVAVADFRAGLQQYVKAREPFNLDLANIINTTVPGLDGDIPVRIYKPKVEGPLPALVYMHGGGFVIGTLDTEDMICQALCYETECAVVSVDYRLAPEHPFPAAVDDTYSVVTWVHSHGEELGIDSSRLAVAGASAGASLSAACTLKLRDENKSIVCAQLLFYGSMEKLELDSTQSMIDMADGPIITADDILFYQAQYLSREEDNIHPYAFPALAADHGRLPPAFVCVAEFDPARDSGINYADKLKAADVSVEFKLYKGMTHGFMSWLASVDTAKTAITDASSWLKQQFSQV